MRKQDDPRVAAFYKARMHDPLYLGAHETVLQHSYARPGSEGSSICMPYYNTYTHADPEDDVDADEREELDPA